MIKIITYLSFIYIFILLTTCSASNHHNDTEKPLSKNYTISLSKDYMQGDGKAKFILMTEENTVHDSIIFYDLTAIDTIIPHQKNYLEISMWMYGGSDMDIKRTAVIRKHNVKIYKSLDIISEFWSSYNGEYAPKGYPEQSIQQEHYKNNITFINDSTSINIDESYVYKVDEKVVSDSSYTHISTLKLKPDLGVYFNNITSLVGDYILTKNIEEKPQSLEILDVPTITLKEDEYYFIDNKWFMKGDKNYLIEMY